MPETPLRVDRLGTEDVEAATALSGAAGWVLSRADWRALIGLEAADVFAGRLDGELVATASLVRYGETLGWVGMMLVAEPHRRRGFGTRMLEVTLEAADRADLAVVGLDASADGRPLYEDAGFVAVGDVTRRRGSLAGTAQPEAVGRFEDPAAVASFDRRAVGVDRRFVLRALLTPGSSEGLLRRAPDGRVRGYAVLRPEPPGAALGPVVAADAAVATDLLRAAGADVGGPLTLRVAGNPIANERLAELGFEADRRLTRMTYRTSAAPLMGESVWGIAAYKYG